MSRVEPVQLLYAFALGVSFAVTFVTISYLTIGYDRAKDPPKQSRKSLEIAARLSYGIANVINVAMGNTLAGAAVVGALFGEILSVVGRFGLDLPKRLFDMPTEKEWHVHIIAPVLYALIFVFLIRPLNQRVITYL